MVVLSLQWSFYSSIREIYTRVTIPRVILWEIHHLGLSLMGSQIVYHSVVPPWLDTTRCLHLEPKSQCNLAIITRYIMHNVTQDKVLLITTIVDLNLVLMSNDQIWRTGGVFFNKNILELFILPCTTGLVPGLLFCILYYNDITVLKTLHSFICTQRLIETSLNKSNMIRLRLSVVSFQLSCFVAIKPNVIVNELHHLQRFYEFLNVQKVIKQNYV